MEYTKVLLGPTSVPGFNEKLHPTWGQVRALLQGFSPEQLQQKVYIWGAEYGFRPNHIDDYNNLTSKSDSVYGDQLTYMDLLNHANAMVSWASLQDYISVEDLKTSNRSENNVWQVEEVTHDLINPSGTCVEPLALYQNRELYQEEYGPVTDEEWADNEELGERENVVMSAGSIVLNNGWG